MVARSPQGGTRPGGLCGRHVLLALLAGVSLLLTGCGVCPAEAIPGVVVTIRTADGGVLDALDVEYQHPGDPWYGCELVGAWDTSAPPSDEASAMCAWEKGAIAIEVAAAGYHPFSWEGRVRGDRCGPESESLDVVLEPLPSR